LNLLHLIHKQQVEIANPLATILSAAMMFEDAFGLTEEAAAIRAVVNKSLEQVNRGFSC
jgi:isocitrate/isopropylmalate dehydrogenase